jgi:lipid-A-disaccharide synthase-like uncharacterized protein
MKVVLVVQTLEVEEVVLEMMPVMPIWLVIDNFGGYVVLVYYPQTAEQAMFLQKMQTILPRFSQRRSLACFNI